MNIGSELDQSPLTYWKESPISRVTDVHTPLLLLHGKKDRTVSFEQSIEMFNGLLDEGKEAQLALYPDAGHGDILDLPDVTSRVTGWFVSHLQ